jgi:hypothetical protein
MQRLFGANKMNDKSYNECMKALSQNIIEAAFFYTIRPKQKNERT